MRKKERWNEEDRNWHNMFTQWILFIAMSGALLESEKSLSQNFGSKH